MSDPSPTTSIVASTAPRVRRRKVEPYVDVRPSWTVDPSSTDAVRVANYEICDAILRNNHKQAMQALGIIRWENNGANVEIDQDQARLVNPNLIDIEAPWAWQYFRRELSHRSLLHEAIAYSSSMVGRGDDPTIIQMLLARGALITITDGSGNSPLHVAAYTNHANAAKILISAGTDINLRSRRGQTPLHAAVHHDCADVCEILLLAGADPTIKNTRYEIPADMAAKMSRPETAALLHAARARQTMQSVIAGARGQSDYGDEADPSTPIRTPQPR